MDLERMCRGTETSGQDAWALAPSPWRNFDQVDLNSIFTFNFKPLGSVLGSNDSFFGKNLRYKGALS
jgi:hypothetical protein